MSRELMQAFFERDLTAAEMQVIAVDLRTSPEESAYFAELVAEHYLSLGLKAPRPGGSSARFLWAGIGALALAAGIWLNQGAPKEVPPVPVQAAKASLPTPTEATAPAIQKVGQALAQPAIQPTPFLEGENLAIEVELPKPMHVLVDLFDAQGRRLRRVFDGDSPAGSNKFSFDGKDRAGKSLPAGRYRVVVDYGDGQLEKWFEVR